MLKSDDEWWIINDSQMAKQIDVDENFIYSFKRSQQTSRRKTKQEKKRQKLVNVYKWVFSL